MPGKKRKSGKGDGSYAMAVPAAAPPAAAKANPTGYAALGRKGNTKKKKAKGGSY